MMRANSAFISDAALADVAHMKHNWEQRRKTAERLCRKREMGPKRMLEVLDFRAGDVDLEHDLRDTIEGMGVMHEKRRKDVHRGGRSIYQ
jgi:hypothetical protein